MASPVPVATYGRDPKVATAVRDSLLPDFDVVHSCLDVTSAESELPSLCAGELETVNASGLGSNSGLPAAERKVPRAILVGGGVGEDEFERLAELVKGKAPNVSFFRVSREEIIQAGAQGPDPAVIAKIYRQKMESL